MRVRPTLVVIGSSAGGIEACEMMEMLAAKDYDGKVLVLGPRTIADGGGGPRARQDARPGDAAIACDPVQRRDLGRRGGVLLHAKAAPAPPPEAPRLRARAHPSYGTSPSSTRARSRSAAPRRAAAADDPSERIEHERRSAFAAARSERVMARVAEDWRCFPCPERRRRDRARAPDRVLSRSGVGRNAVPAVARSPRPSTGLIIEINAAAAVRELGL
jgi:hypothetical protein